jgi:hypothetical protein
VPDPPPGPPTHAAVFRNTALLLTGLLALLAALVGGIALVMQLASRGEDVMHGIFGVLGAFVLGFVAVLLASLRRHRWTLHPAAIELEERPLVPLTGRRRAASIPYAAIAGLFRVQNMREELLELLARDGRRFRIAPGLLPGEGPKGIRYPDQAGLAAFAEAMRGAAAAAGSALPPVADGLGFWNRGPGLAVLAIALLASLGLAGLALWGLFAGAASSHRGGEMVGILVMLPVGLGWFLGRVWRRRRAVQRRVG